MKLSVNKEDKIVAGAYVAYMILFYFIGITGARFSAFVALVLLTGLFALGVRWAKKILAK